jgi:hypothetical protein
MSQKSLVPSNLIALSAAPTIPTLRAGDAYYNTTLGQIQVYTGSAWETYVTTADTQTLTNKTISGASNTITNVSLTAGVTGTLPVTNGGTGVTTSTGTGSTVRSTSPTIATPTMSRPVISAQGGAEGGEINLASPVTGTTINGGVNIDLLGNIMRIFEGAGTYRGMSIDITSLGASVASVIATTDTTQTFTNKTINTATINNAVLKSPEERWTVSATAATGTVTFDTQTRGVLYYTSNATGNWTLNATNVNANLAVGDAMSIVFAVTNGATAYRPTGFQIDGTSQTIKWAGGTAPTAGNANAVDWYSYVIVKTAATPTYTVFAGQSAKFA